MLSSRISGFVPCHDATEDSFSSILFGDPENQQETFFGAGSYVGFIDDEGPGHGSKVGPEGVIRTLRVLKGHLDV